MMITNCSCLADRTSRGVGSRFDQLCARGTSDLNRSQKGIVVQAITVRDRAAGAAGLTLSDIPHPHAAENDVIVRVYAAGFTPGELDWPGTWTDRAGRDRTPSVPGHGPSGATDEAQRCSLQRIFGSIEDVDPSAAGNYAPSHALT